ncbi:uncharacterized protein RCC_03006 [Ramularia collo-cygni]|uniref:Uncharacterized protein n=1 Tax=Ramularia collo-cygni TaxID=112498 RepID=A0A2D3V3V6_9PEZI|nr:uncharacterized protein RCC_03006 [Ramularia collo-cygni]CZT17174.1 uncharacterized protein RCC_03006 [Ramularia collo-cygni]
MVAIRLSNVPRRLQESCSSLQKKCDYNIKSETVYRLLSLIGTVMLMLGVIALANAKLQLQFGWAGAFIIINIAHWVAAALPQSSHWDLSCYNYDIVTYPEEEEQCPPAEEGQKSPISKLTRTLQKMLQDKPDQKPKSNFTIALWKAILLTKSIAWVPLKEAAPSTVVWDEWLVEAEIKAKQLWKELQQEEDNEKKKSPSPLFQRPNPDDWDAKDAWNELYKKHNPKPLSTAPTPAPTIQGV